MKKGGYGVSYCGQSFFTFGNFYLQLHGQKLLTFCNFYLLQLFTLLWPKATGLWQLTLAHSSMGLRKWFSYLSSFLSDSSTPH